MRSLHTAPYKTFLGILVEARNKAGITQAVLAERLGKPQSFVSKYERGERRLDIPEFIAIARALNRDASGLVRRIEAVIYSK